MSDINYQLVVKTLAGQWHLTEPQYRCLLHLNPESADDLLMIDTTLSQLFASSPMLADLWMTTPNTALGNDSPMELIEKEGTVGLRKIVRFLCLDH